MTDSTDFSIPLDIGDDAEMMKGVRMLSDAVDQSRSLEELEGVRWSDPPADSTSLVRSVHNLRKRPIKDLSVEDLRRLIGQNEGLRWLVPVALDYLRRTAPEEAETGFYDDDLLSAALDVKADFWQDSPDLARHLNDTVNMLTDLSSYVQEEVDKFRASTAGLL
ncbi:contact-dependent growth inhibition system immunity protein [Streptomyces bauhiniae]|uniref:contact-dependent growth inhibition system immunity protein n=1 Tax=Streptomyces TaxID=1883 RepID=UPI00333049D9